ncbi:family 43 glycosylhydrolase [Peribacillus kribbensis]|uniref:family 43 glycosylhydrolase n=1 Tax=Peribacillus kribbensis TaxID=356658 RepID=UPI0003F839F0|nr:family 43 glycosylhydrolase [Peribacillus kribbensis]
MKLKAAGIFVAAIVLLTMNPLFMSADSAKAKVPENQNLNSGEQKTFKNPIMGDGADPWVIKHSDGFYYYTQTTGNNVTVWKSKDLTHLNSGEKKVVWSPGASDPNRANIWAPELHYLEGRWYIYFAASDGDMGKQRMYVLESDGSDPMGPYHYPKGTSFGKLSDPSDKWAIDGTVLELDRKLYFIWSGWEGDENISQNLYIAPMANPWTISGKRAQISRPELDWEKKGNPLINEGPEILKNHKGQVFLIYSASGSWTDDYCFGMLSLKGKDPLIQSSWIKSRQPVFKSNPALNVYGPGHGSFVKSPDGREDWMVYHAAKFKGAGWNRNIRMQEFSWNKDGSPDFGSPVPADSWMHAPSGESHGLLMSAQPGIVYKYEAEKAQIHHAEIIPNSSASGGAKVGKMDYEDSYIEFNNLSLPKGDYILNVRYSNGMGDTASHLVTVNGRQNELLYDSFGWDSWRDAQMDVRLDRNQDSIRLGKGKLFTEVDSIELIPKSARAFRYEAELAYLKKASPAFDPEAGNQQIAAAEKNSTLVFPLSVKQGGAYVLEIKYKNTGSRNMTQSINVNGRHQASASLNKAKDWTDAIVRISLEPGVNVISLLSPEKCDFDYITISK